VIDIEIDSHRGLGFGTQNKILTYRNAIALGYRHIGWETDICEITKGQPGSKPLYFLYHDNDDRDALDHGIIHNKFFSEVREYTDDGEPPDEAGKAFAEFGTIFPRTNIELKYSVNPRRFMPFVAQYKFNELRVVSEYVDKLAVVKELRPGTVTGYVDKDATPDDVQFLKDNNIDISLTTIYNITPELVETTKNAGKKIVAWTPGTDSNIPDDLIMQVAEQVDGLILNDIPQAVDLGLLDMQAAA
jgi:hypothetical protein